MARTARKRRRLDRSTKLVAFSGGPRDRAWVTLDDFRADVAAARFNGETPRTGRTLGYVLTDGMIDHPDPKLYPGFVGAVARWNPDLASELSTQKEQTNGR